MNADKWTTIIGLLGGVATAASQTGLIPEQYSPIVGSVQGLAIALIGYFTAKPKTAASKASA